MMKRIYPFLKNKLKIKSVWLLAISALYLSIPMNLGLWQFIYPRLDLNSLETLIFTVSIPVSIFTIVLLFLNLLALPYLIKPVLITMILISSAANFMMFHYGVYIDSDMVRNVFETNAGEAFDLVSLSSAIWIFFTGFIPAIVIVFTRIEYGSFFRELKYRTIATLLCCLCIGLTITFLYKNYASFGRNNLQVRKLISPINYIGGTFRYFQKQALANRPFETLDPNAKADSCGSPYPTVFIMIVGETARAMNFSLNGYPRLTNPELASEKTINFKNVYSCGTATAVSVPCLFSSKSKSEFNVDIEKSRENLLDILKQSGYDVLWRDNDGGCKGVCARVPTENIKTDQSSPLCNGKSCYDEVLLENLEERLKGITQNTFIVLHAMGSHGPTYYKRYPDRFKRFKPTCDTADLQSCTSEEIVNTYDNTILYTDYVVAETIRILKRFPNYKSGMMYVSDHGESLGENNLFLHGLPYNIAPDEQIKVPMVFWLSENMQQEGHVNYECAVREIQNKTYSHDNLFHSLLSLMEVESDLYQPDMDIFKNCRAPVKEAEK